MRIPLLVMLMIPISVSVYGQDVRNARWGESVEGVKRSESGVLTREIHEGENDWATSILSYKIVSLGREGHITYSFVTDQLASAFYSFTEIRKDDDFFLSLSARLSDKYQAEFVDITLDDGQNKAYLYYNTIESIEVKTWWRIQEEEVVAFIDNVPLKYLYDKARATQRSKRDGL